MDIHTKGESEQEKQAYRDKISERLSEYNRAAWEEMEEEKPIDPDDD